MPKVTPQQAKQAKIKRELAEQEKKQGKPALASPDLALPKETLVRVDAKIDSPDTVEILGQTILTKAAKDKRPAEIFDEMGLSVRECCQVIQHLMTSAKSEQVRLNAAKFGLLVHGIPPQDEGRPLAQILIMGSGSNPLLPAPEAPSDRSGHTSSQVSDTTTSQKQGRCYPGRDKQVITIIK